MAVLLMIIGSVIAIYGYARRLSTTTTRPSAGAPGRTVTTRAALRFVWDILFGIVQVFVFACFALAPRGVTPGQRIPRLQARRLVDPMSAAKARQIAGRTRGIL